nr:hypothetical protein [Lachnospiraceae bacterium]
MKKNITKSVSRSVNTSYHHNYGPLCLFLLCLILAWSVAGCGKNDSAVNTSSDNAGNEAASEEKNKDISSSDNKVNDEEKAASSDKETSENKTEDNEISPIKDMVGEWEFIYGNYHSEYANGEINDNCTLITDEFVPETRLRVREEHGGYKVDYKFSGYENEQRIYGDDLVYINESAYKNCPNEEWCAQFKDPYLDGDTTIRKVSLTSDDVLILSEEFFPDEPNKEDDEYFCTYAVTTNYYLRSDSPRLIKKEDLAFFDTVTVSNEKELLNNITNNRKIILKEGTYDLSKMPSSVINNNYVDFEYDHYKIEHVSNLCFEAEEGAKVLICVKDPYAPVLDFTDCNHISLRGLTAGHDVEPGTCSGSVLYFNS